MHGCLARDFIGCGVLRARGWHVTRRAAVSPPAAWGGAGSWERWPHEFLGRDLPEMLNEVPLCFKMRTELLICFL